MLKIVLQDTDIVHMCTLFRNCNHTAAGDHSDHQLTPTPSPPIIDSPTISSTSASASSLPICVTTFFISPHPNPRIRLSVQVRICPSVSVLIMPGKLHFHFSTDFSIAQTHCVSIFQPCSCVFLTIGKLSLRNF